MSIYINSTEVSKESQFIYYVYAYLREDGSPYYIGKGKNNRAFEKHKKIPVPKCLTKIIFLETNLSEIGALALERRYIQWYGRKDNNSGILRNLTDGGEGFSGYRPSKKAIEKMAKSKSKTYWIKYLNTDPFEITNLRKFCRENNLDQSNMCLVLTGKAKHHIGYQIRYSNDLREWIDSNTFNHFGSYLVSSPDNKKYVIKNLTKFCLKHGLHQGAMTAVAKGHCKQHKNWKCEYFSTFPVLN